MNTHEFARRMPKVDLHVHLEGAIRPTERTEAILAEIGAAWDLARAREALGDV